jgi:glycolate oxidase iron-sulfur subunit
MSESASSQSSESNPGVGIEYQRFLDCVHCGLCTSACPTYLLTGNENDGPRGRIYLMRGVTDGHVTFTPEVERHLELCLDCRACETACPSGVQYGRIIEPFRVALAQQAAKSSKLDWFHRWILFGLFVRPDRLRKTLWPARIAQRLKLDRLAQSLGLFRLLSPRLQQLVETLPPLEKPLPELPEFLPAKGPRRAKVALFTGCVSDALYRSTNWNTARVLQANGCDVLVPRGQNCCGAIHFHAGESEPAKQLADANLNAFASECDAIIVNVAGCGAMLKDYGHHWHDARDAERATFMGKVRDVCQFLDQLGLITPRGEIKLTATYHDACHLNHAQKIREAPRRILQKIPGLALVELPETDICCGAAGTYNLTQPEMARQLSRRKLQNILSTGARTVLTGNVGCLLQIIREARAENEPLRVLHPIDLLAESYRLGKQLG